MSDFFNHPEYGASERAFGRLEGASVAKRQATAEKNEIIDEANSRIRTLNQCVAQKDAELAQLHKELELMTAQRNMAELVMVSTRVTVEEVIASGKISETTVKQIFQKNFSDKKSDFIKTGHLKEVNFRDAKVAGRMKQTFNFICNMFK